MWVAHNLSEVMGLPLRSAMPTSSLRSQTEYPFCGSIQCAGQTPVREDLKEGNWMTKENLGTASTSERKLQRVWKSQLLNPPRTFQVSIEPLEFKGSLARTHTRNAAGSADQDTRSWSKSQFQEGMWQGLRWSLVLSMSCPLRSGSRPTLKNSQGSPLRGHGAPWCFPLRTINTLNMLNQRSLGFVGHQYVV